MRITSICTLVLGILVMVSTVHASQVPVGLGAYTTTLHASGEHAPPSTVYKTANLAGPIPTNKWYSSLLFTKWSQPLFAHPLSYLADKGSFELGVPEKVIIRSPSREENDITYPHNPALVIKPLDFKMKDARADKISDWAVDIVMGDDTDALKVTIVKGSPFSFYQVTRGDIKIRSADTGEIYYRSSNGKVTGIRIHGRHYAIFIPKDAVLEGVPEQGMKLHFPEQARWFTVAALPDSKPETIAEFEKYAYAFVTDTHAEWHYDESSSQVTTTFKVTTDIKEGSDNGTLMGLYPHQWHNNALAPKMLPYEYDTVRGKLKLVGGTQFRTRNTYTGILPFWPGLSEPKQAKKLAAYFKNDLQGSIEATLGHGGTYWQGKGFGRATQLMLIAEQQGDKRKRNALLKAIKARMESWLRSEPGSQKYFYYDSNIGTLIGYPDEFGSATELNDHHFHYGYWISAAAQVALRDPAWAAKEKWGGMVDMLIGDIATTDRAHPMFPYLRNFDAYEGHSWAAGIAPFFDGNNQESSSEALNAWAGLILWGEATGNKQLRDTGIYLYTTEIEAANNYWFDLHHQVFAPEYHNASAGIVWGNKYVHTTWFTEDPREIAGINMLPVTAASLYLGTDPNFVRRNIETIDTEFALYLKSDREQHVSPQTWQDILLEYYALYDPKEALKKWDDKGLVEEGETTSHTYHWIQSLINMGRPDFNVTADTPFYAVFRNDDGKNVYLAYNAGNVKKNVTFSDGKTLMVPAHSLTNSFGSKK